MIVTTLIQATLRTIADARTLRAVHCGRLVRIAFRQMTRRVAAWRKRVALARQYDNDMTLLLRADHRMLSDIGITRPDVIAAATDHRWFKPNRMMAAVAQRREEAVKAADTKRDLRTVTAPAIAPVAPIRMLTVETENYR